MMTTRFIGVKEFRQNMTRLCKEMERKNFCLVIMRHSTPIFRVTPIAKGTKLSDLMKT